MVNPLWSDTQGFGGARLYLPNEERVQIATATPCFLTGQHVWGGARLFAIKPPAPLHRCSDDPRRFCDISLRILQVCISIGLGPCIKYILGSFVCEATTTTTTITTLLFGLGVILLY